MAWSDFRASEPQEARSEGSNVRMTREQLVDRIITLNPTATTEFLEVFDDGELAAYLERLSTVRSGHGRWQRSGDSPGITHRRRAG